jgi:N-methylhydantoinase B
MFDTQGSKRIDLVTLYVLASALSNIAEEIGAALIQGSYSPNIKERRDCSTALFDAEGHMIAQAEHIPVHLGAMPEAVAAVMGKNPNPGDVFALNDPYSGGTHLPDITLVCPMALEKEIVGYSVTRAHHSDVGGMSPGSMPSNSREIYQEGIIIPPVRIVREGRYVEEILDLILANVRTPSIRRGDLRAQIAANRLAEERLIELIDRHGQETVLTAFEEVVAYTERRTREVVRGLPNGVHTAESEIEGDGVVDEDIPIKVSVKIEDDEMEVDFSGTADAVAGNVNCPMSVTRSACYFALRVLLPEDVPTNAGTYAALTIRAPKGSLVNAQSPSAVAAGNTEGSQRIAATVLLALSRATEIPAQGHNTMNGLVIGGSDWTYVETIAGGLGASAKGPGLSGVHANMTNTLNTPIEALELEYPLRVERYELAYGSGGEGKYRGGDGIVRSLYLLGPATLSLFTDRRRHGPLGANGGEPGKPGRNLLNDEQLSAKDSRELIAGDTVTICTPGGGGWGRPE